jgi:hypothetical protein
MAIGALVGEEIGGFAADRVRPSVLREIVVVFGVGVSANAPRTISARSTVVAPISVDYAAELMKNTPGRVAERVEHAPNSFGLVSSMSLERSFGSGGNQRTS